MIFGSPFLLDYRVGCWRVFEPHHKTESAIMVRLENRIQVVDRGRERSLHINGETHSIMPTSGSWRAAERECWGAISTLPFPVADNPTVLMYGLGDGTALHLLRK